MTVLITAAAPRFPLLYAALWVASVAAYAMGPRACLPCSP